MVDVGPCRIACLLERVQPAKCDCLNRCDGSREMVRYPAFLCQVFGRGKNGPNRSRCVRKLHMRTVTICPRIKKAEMYYITCKSLKI